MNGLLIIDKPAGMTSHDVVSVVRRVTGERSVGHLGTLFLKGGGRMAQATVDLMDWKLRGDVSKKAQFCGTPALTADGWTLSAKNGFC